MSDRWPDGTPKMKQQMCLKCGYHLDASSAADRSNDKPEPGNVSICLNCGFLAFFGDDLMLRRPTREELADPEMRQLIQMGKRAAAIATGGVDLAKRKGRA